MHLHNCATVQWCSLCSHCCVADLQELLPCKTETPHLLNPPPGPFPTAPDNHHLLSMLVILIVLGVMCVESHSVCSSVDWLISFNVMFSNFIHGVCDRILLFFRLK
jgi:hypothetical protein